ncbi:hypothetical protein EMIHUDRAFT_464079 [Emiliania huxleyi CCMP1516]|uniref:Nucleotide-diphospho-sugar transferase domain-containing protein n=2 Tax=Emiliania huxleyi TaxID=2903 RepID=A0A0D3J5M5_EMIH1|nr:hypothetical protein EMIHUDRAFT_464079 [Emiliania huxleyi CCMP1516]EOD18810.1 hypothetical protein EMIHUDRAFT_464079 [Emiliania huxleyi CCMP1516]|eukprot:XP_005771239.1 hypothetical protein EMIHUDRAFT_464079 [Emiliania huxleyi CCMP1516]
MSVPRAHRWDIVKALPLVLAVLAGLGLLSRHRHSPRAAVADLAPVEVVAVVIASNGYTANYTINTLLTAGRWEGPIYVVGEHCERRVAPGEADAAGCASETWQRPDLLPAGAPSRALGAKAIKTRLLDVAVGAKRVLYLDSDILVQRPLATSAFGALLRRRDAWSPGCEAYFERERTFVRQRRAFAAGEPANKCNGVFVVSGMKLMSRHAPATGVPAARYDLPYWCSGTFVLDVGQSRGLLDTWREEILSGKERVHAVCPLPDDTRYVKDLEGALRGLLHTRTLLHFQTAKASLPDYCAARRGGCSAPATATAQQIVRVDAGTRLAAHDGVADDDNML